MPKLAVDARAERPVVAGGSAELVPAVPDEVDFAVAVWREEDDWGLELLPRRVAEHLDRLVHALRQLPAEGGSLAMVSVGDETFLLVRVQGSHVRLLLADALVAEDCPLGREAVDTLADAGADLSGQVPWMGDLAILADLGIDPVEMRALCEDGDAFPDELLAVVAGHLGVGAAFDRVLDSVA